MQPGTPREVEMSRSRSSSTLPADRKPNRAERDGDTLLAARCRAILMSEEGIARLAKEILEGESKYFWRAIEFGFGKPTKDVEREPEIETEPAGSLDKLSDNAIEFLAALSLELDRVEHRTQDAENNSDVGGDRTGPSALAAPADADLGLDAGAGPAPSLTSASRRPT